MTPKQREIQRKRRVIEHLDLEALAVAIVARIIRRTSLADSSSRKGSQPPPTTGVCRNLYR